ncbi:MULTISPECIES: MetQ/NlpA family ABC transporter substrate-binding protein [Caproicibacterium]|jgi:D-methionine transport system substrate-binding protein|uniref:Lipoprotein n=1 Tax=Caproicibacterium lactatifermentans TaxID=2666138 RepID=A0A859DPE6_9FIRM|nr:MetQ/NlpA family ABC transporter substrate-binding protein [Caproicibacterium lactatifermentans]ARP50858.1 metal ABC transporter substrate-binding protein [Ruminococcaceae bacterium CPB6]MDD4808075.1 MetQ/NlpA family ABC transporter substrate-binding protein [Oscillospiraceae bacterium]QKN23414.1 metal ABC transporter substrate-binding protein [Caproicibacterium lactatifermentans]QKO29908.1 metal ABC transporter substrate-binding protein [Caproicibacterium lactatifermentans]
MKKLLAFTLTAVLAAGTLAGCGGASSSAASTNTAAAKGTIIVGASPSPHEEILNGVVKQQLAKEGYTLVVKEFSDYVQPNLALEGKNLDANYFQHKPYMDSFNKEKNTHLVSMGPIHYEPFGIYAGKTKKLADLKDGATIAVPNDTTNEARALLLLQDNGILKLKANAGITATQKDIAENPKHIKIQEIEAAQLPRAIQDVDLAVINGNYAISGGLKVSDALAMEKNSSLAAKTYANVLAVRQGDENRAELKALYKALTSKETQDYINKKYSGAVVPSTQA